MNTNDLITTIADHVGSRAEKFYKTTLFRGEQLMVGLNCLEPGQVQTPHDHADQDKFYLVMEGRGRFTLGDDTHEAGPGELIWAPAGLRHGVENQGEQRLTLVMGIAPAPS